MANNSPFSKSNRIQIGIIVRDMDKAIEHFESLGIGPFKSVSVTRISREIRGKPVDVDSLKLEVRVANMGPVQFELLAPGEEGGYLWGEFLETRGEGIQHLGFFVDDIDKDVAKLVEKGFKVISSGKFVGGGGFAYFDTGKVGGVLFELIQFPPK